MASPKPRAAARRRTTLAIGTVAAFLVAGAAVVPPAQAAGTNVSWLEAAFNQTSIGDSGAGNANFDGQNGYFIRSLMNGVPTLAPGVDSTIPTDASLHYVLGGATAGVADSIVGKGQTTDVAGTLKTATKIAFVGAASIANQTSDVRLNYADGQSTTISVTLTDWCSGSGAGDNTSLGRTAKRWYNNTEQTLSCGLWYTSTKALRTGTTLESITWPNNSNFHVFAIASDGQPAALTVSGTISLPASVGVGNPVAVDEAELPAADVPGVTHSYAWKVDGAVVSTSAGYVVHEADLGKPLTVTVTAHRSGYVPASVTSAPVTVQAGFQAATAPQVEGTAAIGETLSVAPGEYTETGVTEAYQWLVDGSPITGATSSSLVVAYAQTGKAVSVRVTASKAGFGSLVRTTQPVSVATATALTATPPTVTGAARVGATLTATPGTYSLPGVTVAYQWLRGGTAIAGATGSSYVATQADAGTRLSVRTVGTLALYEPLTSVSAATATIEGGTISVTRAPAVSGSAKVGSTLSVKAGAYSPAGTTVRYQWLRGGAVIKGATSTSYTLVAADKGKAVSVRTSVTKTGFTTLTLTSKATVKVKAGKIVTKTKPKVSGKTKVGKKLKVTKGKYSPAKVKVTYRWLRGGKAIKGATKASYTLKKADRRKKISVKVTVKASGYTTLKVTTKKTAKVK